MDPLNNGQQMGMHQQHNGIGMMPMHQGMHMMSMPAEMVPNMPQQAASCRKSPHDGAAAAPPKKRKKSNARAQATAVQAVNANMMNPGMDPHAGNKVMMGREHHQTIVAQNPFDDFGGPSMEMQHQQVGPRMPPHFMQHGPPPHQNQGGQMPMYGHGPMMNFGDSNGNSMYPQMHMRNMANQPQQMRMMNPGEIMPMRHHYADGNIIKNSQNPNAPPTYLCGKCGIECHENEQAIICESGCRSYYHRTCVGLTEAAYLFILQEPYSEWACNSCINLTKVPFVKVRP